jgi:predicted sugar kinase
VAEVLVLHGSAHTLAQMYVRQMLANTIEADLEEASRILRALQGVGIDCVTWQLQNESVQKYIEPYDVLMQALAAKCQAVLGERS